MNLVPTRQTRALASRMIRDAHQSTGPDAALRGLKHCPPDQLPALVGVLLTATLTHHKRGRPPKPLTLTVEERLRGYSLYRQGVETEFTVLAYREYQRANQRRHRERKAAASGSARRAGAA